MSYTYDYLVFIGRMQPPTLAHIEIMKEALRQAKHLIVLVGSSNSARCPRNPFTFAERQYLISRSIMRDNFAPVADRVHILPLPDSPYNDEKWKGNVQRAVNSVVNQAKIDPETFSPLNAHGINPLYAKIGLIGHNKDASSFYLKMFPMWSSVNVESQLNGLNATDIRKAFFGVGNMPNYESFIPAPVSTFLTSFSAADPAYLPLKAWFEYDRDYPWKNEPINCSDAVCIQSGHILLVTRNNVNGRGQLALPGGHKEKNETFRQCAIRELKEETGIEDRFGPIPPAKLSSFIEAERMFDDPYRSSRGCVTSMAYLFKLPDSKELYKVIGMDDAEKAQWIPIGSLKPEEFFEDHAHIIDTMLGGVFP